MNDNKGIIDNKTAITIEDAKAMMLDMDQWLEDAHKALVKVRDRARIIAEGTSEEKLRELAGRLAESADSAHEGLYADPGADLCALTDDYLHADLLHGTPDNSGSKEVE